MLHKRLLAPLLATALAAPALAQVSPESSASLAAVIAARSDQERAELQRAIREAGEPYPRPE